MIVGLPELKRHLRLIVDDDDDDGSEDDVIAAISRAAEHQVSNWIGRPIYAAPADLPAAGSPDYAPGQIVADDAIRVSIKMLAARLYRFRDGEGSGADDAVPPASVRAMLSAHRVFVSRPGVQS